MTGFARFPGQSIWHFVCTALIEILMNDYLLDSEAGRAVFARWDSGEVQVVTANTSAATERTCAPFLTFLLPFCALMFPVSVQGATLKPETIAAWDDSLQAANAAHHDRIRLGGSF